MRLVMRLVGLMLLLTVGGCAVFTVSRRSHPERPEGARKYHHGTVTLLLPGFDLSLQAQKRVPRFSIGLFYILPIPVPHFLFPYKKAHSRLPIWIELAPRDSAVTFDPRRVVLVTARGDSLRPTALWGPGVASGVEYVRGPDCLCGEPKEGSRVDLSKPFPKRKIKYERYFTFGYRPSPAHALPADPITVSTPTCFVLLFDGIAAGYQFVLLPGQFEVGNRTVDVPPVRFRKHSTFDVGL